MSASEYFISSVKI